MSDKEQVIVYVKTVKNYKPGISSDVRSYANDPFFVKKREEAIAYIKKVGLPPQFADRMPK